MHVLVRILTIILNQGIHLCCNYIRHYCHQQPFKKKDNFDASIHHTDVLHNNEIDKNRRFLNWFFISLNPRCQTPLGPERQKSTRECASSQSCETASRVKLNSACSHRPNGATFDFKGCGGPLNLLICISVSSLVHSYSSCNVVFFFSFYIYILNFQLGCFLSLWLSSSFSIWRGCR